MISINKSSFNKGEAVIDSPQKITVDRKVEQNFVIF